MKKMLAFAAICAVLAAYGHPSYGGTDDFDSTIDNPGSGYSNSSNYGTSDNSSTRSSNEFFGDMPRHTPYIPPDSHVTNPNAYGPGVGSDQYGNAVRSSPYYY